jgi:hypothetical protein
VLLGLMLLLVSDNGILLFIMVLLIMLDGTTEQLLRTEGVRHHLGW